MCLYLKEKTIGNDIKEKIYRDISGGEFTLINDDEIIREVSNFIEKYRNDPELDNLLSWAYQYSNKLIKGNVYSQTQFFTEKYMINYLINNVSGLQNS